MSHESEHSSYAEWDKLTGPQRRLVRQFLADLERAVEAPEWRRPVMVPGAAYLVQTYGAAMEDAEAVAQWCRRARHEDAVRDQVRGTLKGHVLG